MTNSLLSLLIESPEQTVLSEYKAEKQKRTGYQSEDDLEQELIKNLTTQGYEYLKINSEKELKDNLRKQIETLNEIDFTDDEWKVFFKNEIERPSDGIIEKTKIIQEDYIREFKRDNGVHVNIKLIDKDKPLQNKCQVINQYEVNETKNKNRYDVTILINGIPLVHIELKRRGVKIKEAFDQIDRYQKESFWSGSGLYEYIQIFVISNGTNTKYYSNTCRENAITKRKSSNSFDFTSFWADKKNQSIPDLVDFTKTFFAKSTLLNILTKYCVLTTDLNLLVLRPYQIAAVESIISKIKTSITYKKQSTTDSGGYLFHTTGSGKTLTSFVAARLVSNFKEIDKVIFVVDRKDLDAQTISEYERFQKGAVNGNNTTTELKEQLNNDNKKIVVTTIQKLSHLVKTDKAHKIYSSNVVLIFDECHRSQFGEYHDAITKTFKKYFLFGFTGTPIYAKNKANNEDKTRLTTEQVFGNRLHAYTIVDAIRDKNVLPFKIDYVKTFNKKKNIKNSKVIDIDDEEIIYAKERIKNNVEYLLEHYNEKTKRNKSYINKGKSMEGFNSLFACESIKMAIMYYEELKKQIKEKDLDLKIATIFSYAANSDEEEFFVKGMPNTQKEALESAINDYNIMFKTNFNVGSKFYNYYLDLTKRIKNNEIDITIVVNMLLTGFDSPVTDVLWVDKNLEMHNLLQAFSRTNRILNNIKSYGQIVCFRNLKENVDETIGLYGDKDANGIIILRAFEDYLNGYTDKDGKFKKGYKQYVEELKTSFPDRDKIMFSETTQKDFVNLFNNILRLKNILSSFDKFYEEKDKYLTISELQDYESIYLDILKEYRDRNKNDKSSIFEDIEFETDLVSVDAINIDYILKLIEKYHKSNCKDKKIEAEINSAIISNPELRDKKDLIDKFCREYNIDSDVGLEWNKYIKKELKIYLLKIINEENLKKEKTINFMKDCFEAGYLQITGTKINDIMPSMSRFDTKRLEKKNLIIEKLEYILEKYSNLISDIKDF